MKIEIFAMLVCLNLFLAGCAQTNVQPTIQPPISPDQATGTAIVASKYTQAAEATINPPTSLPTEIYPTEDWMGWTPSPSEITAPDSGKTYSFGITSRFSIVLQKSQYPVENLVMDCNPEVVIGRISNIEPAPPEFYVMRYEGVNAGRCILRDGDFEVTINITSQ